MPREYSNIIIYSDFDRTFKMNSEEGVQKNISAIKRFASLGGSFAFATGRGSDYFADLMPNFWDFVNAPMIYYNGAYIYDLERDVVVNHSFFNSEFVFKYLLSVNERYPEVKFNIHLKERKLISGPDIKKVKPEEWIKCVMAGPAEILSGKILPEARKTLDSFHDVTRSSAGCIEIMPKGINKGVGIKLVKEYFRKNFGEDKTVVAIGDYENDTDMLKSADISAAPSNASEEILDIVKIKVCHCNDGAIADLIRIISEEKY